MQLGVDISAFSVMQQFQIMIDRDASNTCIYCVRIVAADSIHAQAKRIEIVCIDVRELLLEQPSFDVIPLFLEIVAADESAPGTYFVFNTEQDFLLRFYCKQIRAHYITD